jgi:hypothetical protein
MKNDKTSDTQGSDNQGADFKGSQDTEDQFNAEQAKDYTIRLIECLRRKAVREAKKDCGHFILARMIEEIYCSSRPVFDADDSLTDHARAAALDAVLALLDNGEFDSYLNDWITPNVYHQMCADIESLLNKEKKLREALQNGHGRKPLITVRFAVANDAEPVTAVVNLDNLTRQQRGWLADRLANHDVCQLWHGGDGTLKVRGENREPEHVVAEAPTAEALLAAIKAEELIIEDRRHQHRHCALAVARQIAETGA